MRLAVAKHNPTFDPDHSCGCDYQRKVRYRNERCARVAAARMAKNTGRDFYPYKCSGCRQWHLSKQGAR